MIKNKKNKGFSLMELMTVVVILGIILSIALGQFNEAQVRARYSSLKVNMRNLQTLVETYGMNYGGLLPGNASQLKSDANQRDYWKSFKNPFSGINDTVKDISDINGLSDLEAGGVLYAGSNSVSSAFIKPTFDGDNFNDTGSYVIYAVDRIKGILRSNGNAFTISNN